MTPSSTYRLQIRAGFDLDAAAAEIAYLRELGVGWAYLSPILAATPGSDHGYDVVDPTRVDDERGGPEALRRFSEAARGAGLGILVDIVPNHQGVADPAVNPWWWDVLLRGRESRYAEAFDIDWDAGGGRLRLPILGDDLDGLIDAGDVTIDTDASAAPAGAPAPHGLVRYYDHALPIAAGTVQNGDDPATPAGVRAILARQHYEPILWRRESEELNYRRFFAVSTLAGVRVEVPWVFDESHAEVLRWLREGLVDGLRIDHPDGLADPGGYLDRLADAAGSPYVLVEKILERGEELPGWWASAGTTGYDALAAIDRVLIDPAGREPLLALDARLRTESTADVGPAEEWSELIDRTKTHVAASLLGSELRRLLRVRHAAAGGAAPGGPEAERERDALTALLASFAVYRAYLPAGREHLAHAAADATARHPALADEIAALADAAGETGTEFAVRFAQTTGPVMAKGVEDTAFYRFSALSSLTEVGGDPSQFSIDVAAFHAAQRDRQAALPGAMTTLSTHDTKRGEDVRARLDALAERPAWWAERLDALRAVATTGNGPFDALLYQAIVGSWPASAERLHAYAEKAARESGENTGWLDVDEAFEEKMHALVDAAASGAARPLVEEVVAGLAEAGYANALSAKLLQLAGPGVPDVYQGSELWERSLVDPDNRRPVDFAERRALLAEIDGAWPERLPPVDETGAAKLLVTSRTLRARRDRPDAFARYAALEAAGAAADHAIAFDRGGAVAVATRLPVGLAAAGGWGDAVLLRPRRAAYDAFTGKRYTAGEIPLADLLATYPVALLIDE